MTDAERVEVLALAWALLDGSPWYRGGIDWSAEGHCLVTAFATAWHERRGAPWDYGEEQAYDALRRLVRMGMPDPRQRAAAYNDAPGRRKRDVLRLYEKAAGKIGK